MNNILELYMKELAMSQKLQHEYHLSQQQQPTAAAPFLPYSQPPFPSFFGVAVPQQSIAQTCAGPFGQTPHFIMDIKSTAPSAFGQLRAQQMPSAFTANNMFIDSNSSAPAPPSQMFLPSTAVQQQNAMTSAAAAAQQIAQQIQRQQALFGAALNMAFPFSPDFSQSPTCLNSTGGSCASLDSFQSSNSPDSSSSSSYSCSSLNGPFPLQRGIVKPEAKPHIATDFSALLAAHKAEQQQKPQVPASNLHQQQLQHQRKVQPVVASQRKAATVFVPVPREKNQTAPMDPKKGSPFILATNNVAPAAAVDALSSAKSSSATETPPPTLVKQEVVLRAEEECGAAVVESRKRKKGDECAATEQHQLLLSTEEKKKKKNSTAEEEEIKVVPPRRRKSNVGMVEGVKEEQLDAEEREKCNEEELQKRAQGRRRKSKENVIVEEKNEEEVEDEQKKTNERRRKRKDNVVEDVQIVMGEENEEEEKEEEMVVQKKAPQRGRRKSKENIAEEVPLVGKKKTCSEEREEQQEEEEKQPLEPKESAASKTSEEGDEEEEEPEQGSAEAAQKGDVLCRWSRCKKQFLDENALYDHVSAVHIDALSKWAGQQPAASALKKRRGSDPNKEEHLRCRWHKCTQFPRRGDAQKKLEWLLTHLAVRHAPQAHPHTCLFAGCTLRFRRLDTLRDHLRTGHADAAPNGAGRGAGRRSGGADGNRPVACLELRPRVHVPHVHDCVDARTMQWLRQQMDSGGNGNADHGVLSTGRKGKSRRIPAVKVGPLGQQSPRMALPQTLAELRQLFPSGRKWAPKNGKCN